MPQSRKIAISTQRILVAVTPQSQKYATVFSPSRSKSSSSHSRCAEIYSGTMVTPDSNASAAIDAVKITGLEVARPNGDGADVRTTINRVTCELNELKAPPGDTSEGSNASAGSLQPSAKVPSTVTLDGHVSLSGRNLQDLDITEQAGVKLIKPSPTSPACNGINLIDSYVYLPSIPDVIKTDLSQPCVLGVDEAGRGPVLGPMVYGVCYCPISSYEALKKLGFADSKTLKEDERDQLFEALENNADIARSSVHVLSPQSISAGMLRGQKYNLNEMAHEATIGLIRRVLDLGINISEIYVDTVGPPSSYQAKLCRMFPGIDITVAKKADSTYPIVSAASIVAKVTRDAILKNWAFAEPNLSGTISQTFGSGYPSDPNTVRWLNENIDPVFGYPSIIRFSWSTTATILEKKAASVIWPETEEKAKEKGSRKILTNFVKEPIASSKLMLKMRLKTVCDFA